MGVLPCESLCPLTAKCRAQVQQVPARGAWRPHPRFLQLLNIPSCRCGKARCQRQQPGGHWGVSPQKAGRAGLGHFCATYESTQPRLREGRKLVISEPSGRAGHLAHHRAWPGLPPSQPSPYTHRHTRAHTDTSAHARTGICTEVRRHAHTHALVSAPLRSGFLVRTSFLLV